MVKRSAGAFIGTLVAFGVVDDSNNKLILQQKLFLNEEQACVILKLFALDVLHSPQVSLSDLPKILFNFFEIPDLRAVAQKYNGVHWNYQHRIGGDFLTFYRDTKVY